MQPISINIFLLCGFTAFNSAPSNVADAMTSYQFRKSILKDGFLLHRLTTFTSVRYSKYRYTIMNRLKMYYYRAYTYSYNFGEAGLYHRAYSYVARINEHRAWTSYSRLRQCGNFETNRYGDFIGFFECPLFFEPRNFTYCCGAKRSHYCCSLYRKSNPYLSDPNLGHKPTTTATPRSINSSIYKIVFSTLGVFVVIRIIVVGILRRNRCCMSTRRPAHQLVTTNIGPGEGLQQSHPSQPLTATPDPTAPAPYPQQSDVMMAPPSYDDCFPPGAAQPQVGDAEPSGDAPPPYPGPATA